MPYKVVRVIFRGGKPLYCSAVQEGFMCQYYRESVWSLAHPDALKYGYGLTYFDNLDEALVFDMNLAVMATAVWECEIDGEMSLPKTRNANITYCYDLALLGIYLEGGYRGNWPQGTKMAKAIKLTKNWREGRKL